MARIRTIKPEFFTDEDVAQLPPLGRIFFAGLWTEADREGRLEDKAKTLKVKLLPFDDVDADALLNTLAVSGFVRRYVGADGRRYLDIPGFKEHQRCNLKEAASKIPAFEMGTPVPSPPTEPVGTCRHVPDGDEAVPTAQGREGKGREGNGREGNGEAPPPPKVHSIPDIQRPTTPPEAWLGDDFWAWAQDRRQAGGLTPERRRPRDLGAWYSGALMSLNGNVGALQEAFYRFGESAYWQGRDPPLPFAGFVAQWDQFLPAGVTRAAS